MADFKQMHAWDLSPGEAKKAQQDLRQHIRLQPLESEPDTIGGADISYDLGSDTIYAAIVVLSYPALVPLAESLAVKTVSFPYIPGLLSFREIPPLISAWEQLPSPPDVMVMDGHGLAHPRRMGLGVHFGILTGTSTFGCAKNNLTGTFSEPTIKKGSTATIIDKEADEQIGTVVRTRTNVKPVFVSPGYAINFEQTVELTLTMAPKYRIPAATRQAHLTANQLRRNEKSAGYKEL